MRWLLSLGFRNLTRNFSRHFATGLAVALGVAGLLALTGYINRWEHTLTAHSIYLEGVGTVAIYKKNGVKMHLSSPKKFSLREEEQEKINEVLKAEPGFEHAAGVLKGVALLGNGCKSVPVFVRGYNSEVDALMRQKPLVLKWAKFLVDFKKGQGFAAYAGSSVVGITPALGNLINKSMTIEEEIAKKQQKLSDDSKRVSSLSEICEHQDSLPNDANVQLFANRFSGSFNAIDANIAHFYTTGSVLTEETRLTTTLANLQGLLDTSRVTYVAAHFKETKNSELLAFSLQQKLIGMGLEVDVVPWNDESISPLYVGVMNFLRSMGFFFSILIVSVIVLAVVNATSMTLMERAKEIGTLRSVGYSVNTIAKLIAAEGFWLGLFSTTVGILGGILACGIVNEIGFQFRPPGFAGYIEFLLYPDAVETLFVAFGGVLLVTLSSYFTTLYLARKPVINLLGLNFS